MAPVARDVDASGQRRYDLTRVTIAGKPIVVTAGTFYLEYREDGRKVRRAIGDHPREVKAAISTQASVIALRAKGVATDDAPQIRAQLRPEGKSIRAVVDAFIKNPPLEYRPRSFAKYRNALQTYATWTSCTHTSQVDREEIRAFMTALVREQGIEVSTAVDKGIIVAKIMRDAGAPIVMKKGDWPKVTEPHPQIYRPEILSKLFAAAGDVDHARFQTFLQSGMREQEVAHLWWDDFDAKASTLRVRKKLGFDPKTYQERTVPVPRELVALLQKHRKAHGAGEVYIFPTSRHNAGKGCAGGQADGKMLEKLKLLAFRAGLNCGRCATTHRRKAVTCATAPVCGEFGLHKFRHTYATTLLRDGVDIVSLQKLLGHADIESTMKYLRALAPEDLLKKINRTSLAKRFVEGAKRHPRLAAGGARSR